MIITVSIVASNDETRWKNSISEIITISKENLADKI